MSSSFEPIGFIGGLFDRVIRAKPASTDLDRLLLLTFLLAILSSICCMACSAKLGDCGNGEERRRRLGSYYSIVQSRVNEMLS